MSQRFQAFLGIISDATKEYSTRMVWKRKYQRYWDRYCLPFGVGSTVTPCMLSKSLPSPQWSRLQVSQTSGSLTLCVLEPGSWTSWCHIKHWYFFEKLCYTVYRKHCFLGAKIVLIVEKTEIKYIVALSLLGPHSIFTSTGFSATYCLLNFRNMGIKQCIGDEFIYIVL